MFRDERENQALSRRLKNVTLRTANACVEEIDYRTARGLDKGVIRSLTQESAWVGTHQNKRSFFGAFTDATTPYRDHISRSGKMVVHWCTRGLRSE